MLVVSVEVVSWGRGHNEEATPPEALLVLRHGSFTWCGAPFGTGQFLDAERPGLKGVFIVLHGFINKAVKKMRFMFSIEQPAFGFYAQECNTSSVAQHRLEKKQAPVKTST